GGLPGLRGRGRRPTRPARARSPSVRGAPAAAAPVRSTVARRRAGQPDRDEPPTGWTAGWGGHGRPRTTSRPYLAPPRRRRRPGRASETEGPGSAPDHGRALLAAGVGALVVGHADVHGCLLLLGVLG